MDTNIKKWHWTQFLVVIGFLFYIYNIFSTVFMIIAGLRLRITLAILIALVVNIYNVLNVFGLSVNQSFKKLSIPILAPNGVLVFELVLFYFMRKMEVLTVNWKGLFLNILVSLVFSGIMLLFHKKNEIITIPITEKENA